MRFYFYVITLCLLLISGCSPADNKSAQSIQLEADEINPMHDKQRLPSAEAIYLPGNEGSDEGIINLDFQADPIKIKGCGQLQLSGLQNSYPKRAFICVNSRMQAYKIGDSIKQYRVDKISDLGVRLVKE